MPERDVAVVMYNGLRGPIIRIGRVVGYTEFGDVRVKYDGGGVYTCRKSHVHVGVNIRWAEALLARHSLSSETAANRYNLTIGR